MAGSKKYFKYTASGGEEYALYMDESNGEHVGNADVTPADTGLVALPRNIKPRFCVYRSNDGRYQRKIYVTDPLKNLSDFPSTLEVTPEGGGTAITLLLSYLQGERTFRVVRADDTGINDGDAT